jgi:hypothetical protein
MGTDEEVRQVQAVAAMNDCKVEISLWLSGYTRLPRDDSLLAVHDCLLDAAKLTNTITTTHTLYGAVSDEPERDFLRSILVEIVERERHDQCCGQGRRAPG